MKRKLTILILLTIAILQLRVFAYTDITDRDWFYQDVSEITDYGYLAGYEDGSFRPSEIITKAELVSIAARASNLTPSAGQTSHWADGMMSAAIGASYYDWDEIPPTGESFDEPITRQLAVKIIMKALLPDLTGNYNDAHSAFKDFDSLDGRYYDAVFAAYSNGIIYGDDKGNLNPKSDITRAETCAIIMRAIKKSGNISPYTPPAAENTVAPVEARKGGVSENGFLHVEGTKIVNENGENVVLHGMSSHGLQWFPTYACEDAIKATADYGANLFRCAMYTAEGGYLSDRSVKNTLISAVDAAIRQDMYVIIDWHILSDGNPMSNTDAAIEFFSEMSKKYADNPSVIYEICNEPNGNISWSGDVKPYAEKIISVIRENTDAVVLVGSPTWSQDLHEAAKDPINADNIMYTCHFYAGTHTDWLRQRIVSCGLPVFVSEWGTSAADGNGGVYLDEAQRWIDFMNENGISWANWSLCDKNESSAALKPNTNVSDGISDDELTESGAFVFSNF